MRGRSLRRGPRERDISATHRLRLSQADAHYGGGLVAGAKLMELFGDVATELCIRSDGDEGLFAGYSSVEFLAPLHAGDFIEVRAEIVRAGQTSREMAFEVLTDTLSPVPTSRTRPPMCSPSPSSWPGPPGRVW